MSDIFINHAPTDNARARALMRALTRQRWEVQTSANQLGPGTSVMLVLCSPQSMANAAVHARIETAKQNGSRIVPIVIRRATQLPISLSLLPRLQWSPPGTFAQIHRLLRDGKQTIGQPAPLNHTTTHTGNEEPIGMVAGIALIVIPLMMMFFLFTQLSQAVIAILILTMAAGTYLVVDGLKTAD